MRPRFSIIIPAYNEERFLPRLIESIDVAAAHFHDGNVEIIVADNSSTDLTAHISQTMGADVVTVRERCIAAARNGGASVAVGEVLCFIDADSALHPDTFSKIDLAMRDEKIIGGATGIYLERMSPGLLIVYCLMLPMLWLTNFDTGVVFCRREDFDAVGGYNEDLLLAEDVDFLFALKKRGWKKGQRLTRLKGVKALGSTRKFDEHGDWHYFKLLSQIARSILRYGFRATRLNNGEMPEITNYWYQPNR
jgi:glycosyltransferase involved in cell wall biosynthesis